MRTFSDFCQEFIVQMADAEMKESPAPVVETVKKRTRSDSHVTRNSDTLKGRDEESVRGILPPVSPGAHGPVAIIVLGGVAVAATSSGAQRSSE